MALSPTNVDRNPLKSIKQIISTVFVFPILGCSILLLACPILLLGLLEGPLWGYPPKLYGPSRGDVEVGAK